MKISSKNIIRALRIYDLADDNSSPKQIRKLKIHDGEYFVRAEFVFNNKYYGLLFGSSIGEDSIDEVWPGKPLQAEPLGSPLDESELAIPFHGKYLMIFHIPATKQRLDTYLSNEFDSKISRSLWQKYIKAGYVSVNSKVQTSTKFEVSQTDDLAVSIPEATDEVGDLPIIYEDDDIIAIDKPAGVLTHAKGGIVSEKTVADFFRDRTKYLTDTDRPGIIHRLDRDTSGVLVGARNETAAKSLQKQFADRKAKKVYLAVVEGAPKLKHAKIDLPIARHPSKPSTFRVDPKGKSAETTYQVLASNKGYSLVKLEPRTGRTHQLRVHMAHIGTPIVGDKVYGKTGNRLMLHAYELGLTLPSGQNKIFKASLPKEFLADFPGLQL